MHLSLTGLCFSPMQLRLRGRIGFQTSLVWLMLCAVGIKLVHGPPAVVLTVCHAAVGYCIIAVLAAD
jgi:uncharacterized membrane protein